MDDVFKAWDKTKSKDWTKCKKMALDIYHRFEVLKPGLAMNPANKKAVDDIEKHEKVV